MSQETKSTWQLLEELANSVGRLGHHELRLVREESSEKASQAMLGLIGVIGGMLVALASLLVLVQALVVALADYMPAELAALVVGLALAVIAFVLMRSGRAALGTDVLTLPKTARSLERDKDLVMETMR
jgi:hypothetical protein